MCFFRDGCVTDFCSCKIGIPYIPVHKPRVEPFALIARDGMYAGFAGAKACHEKITIFQRTLESEIISLHEYRFYSKPLI